MLSVARLRRARSVWKSINYPIFIPEEDPEIVGLLVNGEADKLAEALKRRALLGSGSAAALVGFLELMGTFSGEPNPELAIAGCTVPAKAGDPYARYVLSWASWVTGKKRDALHWMTRSIADSKFLPARLGLGRMLLTLAENDAEVRDAIRILWYAHRLGHVAALPVICGAARRGQLGPVLGLLGIIVFPYALIRATLVTYFEPFSVRSFTYVRKPGVPFFSSQSKPRTSGVESHS